MTTQQTPVMNVFPAKQQRVPPHYKVNVVALEMLANSAAVFVMHDAEWFVKHLPAALPGNVAQIRVFKIERIEDAAESAELEKLRPVKSA
jgi:hypothetical protein